MAQKFLSNPDRLPQSQWSLTDFAEWLNEVQAATDKLKDAVAVWNDNRDDKDLKKEIYSMAIELGLEMPFIMDYIVKMETQLAELAISRLGAALMKETANLR